jgi:hypothetical protein
MNRLIAMLERAADLGLQVQDAQLDTALAEEVTSECSELLALLKGNTGFHHDEESKDQELVALTEELLK